MKFLTELERLTPEMLIEAYSTGFFPMADSNDGEIAWYSPDPRAIIPLDAVRVSRSLRQAIKKNTFEIRVNTAFHDVIRHCSRREETWISDEIIRLYTGLHELGFAHSVESWMDGELVGGLYGIALGGAFFGESMFALASNASKIAYVASTERLNERGFVLLDSQFINPHTESLGAIEITRDEYLARLADALQHDCSFA